MSSLPEFTPVLEDNRRPRWQVVLGLAISLVSLYLALRGVQFAVVWQQLRSMQILWVIVAVALSVSVSLVKARRWQVLFVSYPAPTYRRSLATLSIGVLVNFYLPARFGDIVRAYLAGISGQSGPVYALGTIFIEKLFDLAAVIVMVALLLLKMTLPGWLVGPATVLAVFLLLIFPLLFFLAWLRIPLNGEWSFLPLPWRLRLSRLISRSLESLVVLKNPGRLMRLVWLTLIIWVCSILTNYAIFQATGLKLSVLAIVFLLVVLQAGIVVPASPGLVGVFHYLTVLSLAYFGVGHQSAFEVALVLHLVVVGPPSLLGCWFLWRERIGWDKLVELGHHLGSNNNAPTSGNSE